MDEETPPRRSRENDDEAERLKRRLTLSGNNTSTSSADEVSNEEQLKNCLKIYQENKINKDNAWSMTLIDNFANMLSKHHKTARNFQFASATLDATSRIYALRVDSVHMDALRISSGLGRLKNDRKNDHDDDDDNVANETAANDTNVDEEGKPAPKIKKKRARKAQTFIEKNKERLNAPLETGPLPDPLFSKLNSIMGDVSSSNRLLLNILPTKKSDLKLTLEQKYWDSSDPVPLYPDGYDDTNLPNVPEDEIMDKPIDWSISVKNQLRQHLVGYTVTNTPMDDDDDEVPPAAENLLYNQSQLDYAFDINAEVEAEPADDHFVMEFDVEEAATDGNAVELTAEDRDAIQHCKGLRRVTNNIEELRPIDTSKLEYSYRPLDQISQYWAGPSYWKFRKSRLPPGTNTTAGTVVVNANANAAKRRQPRVKLTPAFVEDVPVDISEDTENYPPNNDDSVYLQTKSKNGQKFMKSNLYKRLDGKKLKLPTDHRIDRNLFDTYEYAAGAFKMAINLTINPQEPIDNANTDAFEPTPADSDHHDDDHHHADDVGDVHDIDHTQMDVEPMDLPNADDPNAPVEDANKTAEEIRKTMDGAPQMVQKIEIQFAKRAKVIDMKQMKSCCLQTITKQCERTASKQLIRPQGAPTDELYKDGAASFAHIYHTLPNLLTKTMTENLTPSVAFYSILHLANENRLRLYKSANADDCNTFLIRRIE